MYRMIPVAVLLLAFSCSARKETIEMCKAEWMMNIATQADCESSSDPASCLSYRQNMELLVAYKIMKGCEEGVSHAPYPFRLLERLE